MINDPIFDVVQEHKLDATSINEESGGDDMNESIDDSNSSHISSTTSSRSHSEFGNSSHPGSSIGSAGSLVLRNRISIWNARTNTKLVSMLSSIFETSLIIGYDIWLNYNIC